MGSTLGTVAIMAVCISLISWWVDNSSKGLK
jgi:hypothetical protein